MRRSSCKESPKTQRRQPIELNAWLSARPVHVPAQTPTDPPFLPAWTETPLTRFSPLRSRCAVQIGCRYADRTVTRLSVQYAEWRVQNAPGGRQPVADSSSIIPMAAGARPGGRHSSSFTSDGSTAWAEPGRGWLEAAARYLLASVLLRTKVAPSRGLSQPLIAPDNAFYWGDVAASFGRWSASVMPAIFPELLNNPSIHPCTIEPATNWVHFVTSGVVMEERAV